MVFVRRAADRRLSDLLPRVPHVHPSGLRRSQAYVMTGSVGVVDSLVADGTRGHDKKSGFASKHTALNRASLNRG